MKRLQSRIRDESSLAAAYMPFIRNGGLFVSTSEELQMGDEVNLQLNLLDNCKEYSVRATVVWITPETRKSIHPQGVGLRFEESETRLRHRIEDLLAANSFAELTSHTL